MFRIHIKRIIPLDKFFVDRVINVWNALPSTVKFTSSLDVFRNSIEKTVFFLVFLSVTCYILHVRYPVTILLNVLGQLLVFLSDLAVLLYSTVLMWMRILLYYWANKMMMVIRLGKYAYFIVMLGK